MNGSNGDATSDDASSGASGGGGGSSGTTLKKGPWTAAEDAILLEYVKKHGEGNWNAVQKNSGLSRCGKSCRLRWANHLRPNLKKGSFSPDEERLILELHAKLGNKWARMAAQLPGRTDNEIKNYWNTRVKRRQRAGLPLYPHDIQKQAAAFHHHHHHHHQSHPSPSPSPPTHLSSTQQPKPNFMSASLSPFDPISFSTNNNPHLSHHGTPFLSTPIHHQFKRFRDNTSTTNNLGFSLPFSPPPPPPPSSLLSQSLSIQLPTPSSFQFNPGNFDLNPPSIPPSTNFSMKLELPSSQLPQAPAIAAASGSPNEFTQPLGRNNSGLLDALLQEAQTMASNHEDTRREGLLASQEQKCGLDGMVSDAPPSGSVFSESTTTPLSATTPPPLVSTNQWDDLSSARSSLGAKTKKEPRDEINSVDDELSGFLDVIPSTMSVCEWYSDSGEMSNGQSSGMTDDDIGLEMQHLASSLSVTTTSDHEWTLGSSWNNMPGIC